MEPQLFGISFSSRQACRNALSALRWLPSQAPQMRLSDGPWQHCHRLSNILLKASTKKVHLAVSSFAHAISGLRSTTLKFIVPSFHPNKKTQQGKNTGLYTHLHQQKDFFPENFVVCAPITPWLSPGNWCNESPSRDRYMESETRREPPHGSLLGCRHWLRETNLLQIPAKGHRRKEGKWVTAWKLESLKCPKFSLSGTRVDGVEATEMSCRAANGQCMEIQFHPTRW